MTGLKFHFPPKQQKKQKNPAGASGGLMLPKLRQPGFVPRLIMQVLTSKTP
ncbi:hypothetical protein GTCCBUS3UF5_38200 [Geobacillus thermoleovorans CCB_US3_UF5]|uniref:Uncharacterized protein n=1 Tax=Geobacillus thermoleovorans CCB_US3_UF5 TaxID=1111068 RepID=A0ABM5MMX1_GEOTH|nr:hypothetical protein GTCCBUS3UF5_38200 [Geobacillus thermoleovorans CCB_US3_UF5]EPR26908.1 hypothetical protein I656_03451 [Geobacillus sp. WSUCF1]